MTHSESISKLAPALVAFGGEVTNPHNSAVNPFHKNKYAPLNDILNEVRPLLSKHGLTVSQLPVSAGEQVGVTTVVLHESGEYLSDTITMAVGTEKGKSAAQLAGSIITYLRRYSLAAALNIASEDDDDGNAGLPRKEGNTKPVVHKDQSATDYSLMDAATMEPEYIKGAIRQELVWLDEHKPAVAAEYREAANIIKSDSGTKSDKDDAYRKLLSDMRETRNRDGYEEKRPVTEEEIF